MAPTNCARRITRQLRVRVQRDDVLHLREDGRRADDERKIVRSDRRARARSSRQACRACVRDPSRSARPHSSVAGGETDRTRCRAASPASAPSAFRFPCRRCSPWPYFRFSSLIRASASRSSGSSAGSDSSCASGKSVSKPKCRCASRLARNRTSSASTRSSTLRALVSMVGTTTSVRASAAMPAEKSIRGSGCGVTSNVASQFTIVTAN